MLGLAFVLLLERGPGREHIAIQSYMLALVAGLGALFALILAAAPVRDFFEMALLTATQWFLALLSRRDRPDDRQRCSGACPRSNAWKAPRRPAVEDAEAELRT